MNSDKKLVTAFLLFLFFCVQVFTVRAYAQEVSVDSVRAYYADAKAIYLKRKYEYVIWVDKDQLKGVCNVQEQKLINKETGIGFNSKEISIDAFTDAKNIKAYTLIPKNKKYVKKEVEKIELEADISGYTFYDDEKAYKFTYPSVQVGAILDLNYQLVYKELRFMGIHFWSDYLPIAENELVIRFPKNVHIGYKLFNCEGANLEFTKEEGKNETVYRWKRKNADAVVVYDNAPDIRYYEPHILFYINDYEINGKSNKMLGSTKELYSWYCSMLKNLNKTDDQQLKKISDSLVEGITDEKEKVRKIFYWVQDNISYVAFEDGLGGFVPRDAGLVCHRKFGDCKDMASIICEMLRFAGIKAYHTWLGTRDIPYNFTDIPTPYVDNHMIASYRDKEGNWNFLDATGKKAPMELYTSMIQGKQALIGIDCDSFLVVPIPIKDTNVNQTIDSVTIAIKDKSVTGKGKVKLTGYNGLHYLYRTDRLGKEEYQDFFRSYFSKGSNKVKFNEVAKVDGNRGDVDIPYEFKQDDYVRYNRDEIYINLSMENSSFSTPLTKSRNAPLNFTHKTKNTLVTTLIIPEGYKAEYVPANQEYGDKNVGFSSSYVIKNNKIIHKFSYYTNFLLLPVNDFDYYNSVLAEQIKVNKQMVSLIKK